MAGPMRSPVRNLAAYPQRTEGALDEPPRSLVEFGDGYGGFRRPTGHLFRQVRQPGLGGRRTIEQGDLARGQSLVWAMPGRVGPRPWRYC